MKEARLFLTLAALFLICESTRGQQIEVIQGRSMNGTIEKSDTFIKRMEDIEWYKDSLYMLDSNNGQIIEIDVHNGNRIRTISQKGQGPGDLMTPCRIRVRNQKIFVLDEGNLTLKIFSLSGDLIGQIKSNAFNNPFYYKTFDVNNSDEVFFPEINKEKGTLIGVYSVAGLKIADLVSCPIDDKDYPANVNRSFYGIGVDPEGAFYLNFPLLNEVWRCANDGKILWKIKIENALINKAPEKPGARVSEKGNLAMSTFMRGMEITGKGNAFIGHYQGGCLVNKQGVTERVIAFQTQDEESQKWNNVALAIYRVHDNLIIGAPLRQSYWLKIFSMEGTL